MQTPLQQQIEQIKTMPAYEFDPVVTGIVEKAESLQSWLRPVGGKENSIVLIDKTK